VRTEGTRQQYVLVCVNYYYLREGRNVIARVGISVFICSSKIILTLRLDFHAKYLALRSSLFNVTNSSKLPVLSGKVFSRHLRRNFTHTTEKDENKDITSLIRIRRLTYFGHVARMSSEQ